MRVSFSHQYDVFRNDLMRTQSDYYIAQQRVSSGKRIQTPSDDPYGTAKAVSLRALRNASDQYSQNLTSAKGFLSMSESTIAEMDTLLKRANELAVGGANGATDQSARTAMAAEITSMQARLVDLANTKGPGERSLFAGQKTDTTPFVAANGTLTYNGDNNDLYVETSPTETMPINTQMGGFLTQVYGQLEALKGNLQGGNQGAISGVDIPAIQASEKALTQLRGTIGTRLQSVNQSIDHQTRRMDDLTSQISDTEDVDMSEAILQYKRTETAYQAAMQTVSMTSRLSLMDFLK